MDQVGQTTQVGGAVAAWAVAAYGVWRMAYGCVGCGSVWLRMAYGCVAVGLCLRIAYGCVAVYGLWLRMACGCVGPNRAGRTIRLRFAPPRPVLSGGSTSESVPGQGGENKTATCLHKAERIRQVRAWSRGSGAGHT